MPSRVVKQPNGLLAVFSTVVDDFTVTDATEAEMVAYWLDQGLSPDEARAKVDRGLRDEDPWRPGHCLGHLGRWKEALRTIAAVHGKRKARQRETHGGEG